MSWFGKIEIGKIKNVATPAAKKTKAGQVVKELKDTDVRFVHYPDCQQLTIWLPYPGNEYGMLRLRNKKTKKITEEFPVQDKLSGSIQVLWDTTTVPPGDYMLEIDRKDGYLHRIDLIKFKEREAEKRKPVKPQAKTVKSKKEKPDEPIVYRDGFGNIIPDEDLILRGKVNNELVQKFSRRIEYKGNLRAGSVIYIDRDTRIEFSNEMGGAIAWSILISRQKKNGRRKPGQHYPAGKIYWNMLQKLCGYSRLPIVILR